MPTMHQLLQKFEQRWLWRCVGLCLALLAVVGFVKSSSAEYELPYINTTNALANVELRGVWSFNRGIYSSTIGTKDAYEAYAVGIDPSKTAADCGTTSADDCNGTFYFFDGTTWSRIPIPFKDMVPGTPQRVYAMNDIVGQYDHGEGNDTVLVAVGVKSQIAVLASYYNTPGVTTTNPDYGLFRQLSVDCPSTFTGCNATYKADRDFLTVDAGQTYNARFFAGGTKGLIAFVDGLSSNTSKAWTIVDPATVGVGPDEAITGIQYSNYGTSYVTTSTFKDGKYDRSCANNTSAPLQQVSRLYRVNAPNTTWTKLAEVTDTCFYGLSVGLRDETSADHGPQKNVIWIASYAGVYKYEEKTGTLTAPIFNVSNRPVYSVVAVQDRGGNQQTLIPNGDFESWDSANPQITNATTNPDSWLSLGEGSYGRNNDGARCMPAGQAFCTSTTNINDVTNDCSGFTTADSCAAGYTCRAQKFCKLNNLNCTNDATVCNTLIGNDCTLFAPGNNNDLHISSDVRPGSTGSYSLKLSPGVTYSTIDACLNHTGGSSTNASGVVARVPLSTIEGQKFKVSGWYKVEFPSPIAGEPAPITAQGGITTSCAGAYPPEYINCSVANRSLIRAAGNPTSADDGQVNGWVQFSLTISREDLIFGNGTNLPTPIVRSRSGNSETQRKMALEVSCVASYGARVWCDDIKVEELSDPTIPYRDTYTVIAAGKDIATNGVLVNTDALHTDSFSKEAVPNTVRTGMPTTVNQINSLSAVGLQHIFAVGQALDTTSGNATKGVAIFQRTPSTLTGTMWVGATSPTGATQNLAAGPISVSCVSAESGLPTLCQRSPESYGISLEIDSLYTSTRTGKLTGQAWYGKSSVADNNDTETLNLGTCLNPPVYAPSATNKYSLTGMCNPTVRLCRAAATGSTYTSKSCLSDFDCFGHCQKDQGFLCITDADCQITSTSFDGPFSSSSATGKLKILPAQRLVCGATVSGTPASPLACTPIGWLTFNPKDVTDTPPTGTFGVKYNTLYTTPTVITSHNSLYQLANQGAHELSGWGRFMSLASAPGGGWVHLRDSSAPVTGTGKLYACRDCNGGQKDQMTCAFCQDEQNRSCVPSNDGVGAAQCYYECQDDAAHTHCAANSDCVGHGSGVCAPPGFCSGNGTTRCSTDNDCASAGGSCMTGAVCKTTSSQCVKYGVNLDTESGKFYGSAWSADLGWIDFRGVSYGGKRIIQTKLGDIYATGNIGASGIDQSQGGATCNSTYLITSAKSITGFCSAISSTVAGATQENVSQIPIISAENSYQNVLGRFDIKGIETKTNPGCTTNCVNKYGSVIVSANDPTSGNLTDGANSNSFISRLTGNNNILGGKVYIASGQTDYTIGQALNFANSSDLVTRGSGAGILIVNGNLTINQSMTYSTAAVADLRQLASLTIVVKGNLIIDNRVTNIVGAYYVSGTVKTTSNPSNDNQYPLRVDGLMIGGKFEFKRQFAGTIERPEASELIVYDGRLQSNPLPGMSDFTSALPNAIRNLP